MTEALTTAGTSRKKRRPSSGKPGANHAGGGVGPYSRWLRRGALGAGVNGSSAEGRFLRDLENQLVLQVGGHPTPAERLLISRIARMALRLELFDRKITSGAEMTAFDSKVYGALHNSFRLCLLELGLKGAEARPPTLAEVLAQSTASTK